MRLAEHFITFHSEFNNFNNTGARILDSTYHMMLSVFLVITLFDQCENV